MTWIQTLGGKRFNLDNPNADAIDPEDLAMCLARKCRFGGHCREFYSVAQHSVLVSDLVLSGTLALPAMLHDAHEAYTGFGDVLRPAKYLDESVARFIKGHEGRVNDAIAKRFGFDSALFQNPAIKYADDQALATEARDVMAEPPCPWDQLPPPHEVRIKPWSINRSYTEFMRRLDKLLTKRAA